MAGTTRSGASDRLDDPDPVGAVHRHRRTATSQWAGGASTCSSSCGGSSCRRPRSAIAQNALVEERHDDTAPWVLSKPVSRSAYVVAKILGTTIGIVAIGLLLQAALAYAWLPEVEPQTGLPIARPELGRYVVVIGVLAIVALMFVALTIAITTLVPWRGPAAFVGLVVWILRVDRTARADRAIHDRRCDRGRDGDAATDEAARRVPRLRHPARADELDRVDRGRSDVVHHGRRPRVPTTAILTRAGSETSRNGT